MYYILQTFLKIYLMTEFRAEIFFSRVGKYVSCQVFTRSEEMWKTGTVSNRIYKNKSRKKSDYTNFVTITTLKRLFLCVDHWVGNKMTLSLSLLNQLKMHYSICNLNCVRNKNEMSIPFHTHRMNNLDFSFDKVSWKGARRREQLLPHSIRLWPKHFWLWADILWHVFFFSNNETIS